MSCWCLFWAPVYISIFFPPPFSSVHNPPIPTSLIFSRFWSNSRQSRLSRSTSKNQTKKNIKRMRIRLFFLETSLFCCGVNNGRQKKAFCHITRRRFFLFLITGIRFDSPLIDRTYFTHPYWLRGLGSQRHHRVRFKSYLQIRSFRLCSDTKFRQHSPV